MAAAFHVWHLTDTAKGNSQGTCFRRIFVADRTAGYRGERIRGNKVLYAIPGLWFAAVIARFLLPMNTIPFSDPALLEEIAKFARRKHLRRHEELISAGESIFWVPIVLSGVLRIVRQGDDGREVFLYHLYPGETCAMAVNCCQSQRESMIKAIAGDDTEVLQIPVKLVEDWFRYAEWRTYINNTYSSRFAELIEVIDLIAFSNMDRQVLHYLQQRARAEASSILQITHQQIADELHTHREAVSRLLRAMEEKKLVKLGRNTIRLLHAAEA